MLGRKETLPTLADLFFRRSPAGDAVLLLAAAALTAIAAQLSMPLQPLPLTSHTVVIIIVAAALGPWRGVLAMTLYLALGWLGLPVFSNGTSGPNAIAGPSGGFLIGFILCAGIVGWAARRGWDRTLPRALLAATGGTIAIYAVGLPWLVAVRGWDAVASADWVPFAIGGGVKTVLAAVMLAACWVLVRRTAAGGLNRPIVQDSRP